MSRRRFRGGDVEVAYVWAKLRVSSAVLPGDVDVASPAQTDITAGSSALTFAFAHRQARAPGPPSAPVISLKHQFLYVHIPKTAGNAVQNILRQYSEDEIVCLASHQDGVERFEVRSAQFKIEKHSTLQDYHRELGAERVSKLFKFCCVRNPWERAISFYFSPHRGVTKWDRRAFIALVAEIRPVEEFLRVNESGRSPFQNVDFVMRFEQLEEDFAVVCARLGLPLQPLPVRNKSERDHFSRYYDPELVELVRRRFAPELEHFQYEFPAATAL